MTKRTEGMSNKEWLEFVKKSDNTFFEKYSSKISDMPDNTKLQWRQAKALEIIAEELIKLNENIDRDYVFKRGTIDQDGNLVNEE